MVVVGALLCLGIANISARATWHAVEDGVLWTAQPQGVVAADIAAGTAAAAGGIRRGDLLIAIDDRPVQQVSDIEEVLRGAEAGQSARYTILRLGAREVVDVRIAPIPSGPRALYFFLAAVGIFTLLVGGAVRLRRPRDPATLHFFWLSVAFFGVFTFSFSGRLDRLDWVFYWADAVSMLLLAAALPALHVDFSRSCPAMDGRSDSARVIVPLAYVPALVLGIAHVVALARSGGDAGRFVRVLETLDRVEFLYLAGCLIGGLAALVRALTRGAVDHRPAAVAVDCVGHGARRRALRARLRAAVRARRRPVTADAAVRDSARVDSAGVRLGDCPLSPHGHRGDRQARARLRGGARRDRGDLRRAAARRPARLAQGR